MHSIEINRTEEEKITTSFLYADFRTFITLRTPFLYEIFETYKCTCVAFLLAAVSVPFAVIAIYSSFKQNVAIPLARSNLTYF